MFIFFCSSSWMPVGLIYFPLPVYIDLPVAVYPFSTVCFIYFYELTVRRVNIKSWLGAQYYITFPSLPQKCSFNSLVIFRGLYFAVFYLHFAVNELFNWKASLFPGTLLTTDSYVVRCICCFDTFLQCPLTVYCSQIPLHILRSKILGRKSYILYNLISKLSVSGLLCIWLLYLV